MVNFKGQVTPAINELLEANNIQVCLLPPNMNDLLQPMDIAVNKPAKIFQRLEHGRCQGTKCTLASGDG